MESNHRARLRRASLYSPELRTLGCRTGVEPGPGETGRARTGTYPGHNRALCPVKLRPPRLPVSDTHRRPHSGSSRFRACDLRRFRPALLPPELQAQSSIPRMPVGPPGFEPGTVTASECCSARLSYGPMRHRRTSQAPAKRVGRDSNSQHGGLKVPCSAIELPTRDIAEAGLEPATFSV